MYRFVISILFVCLLTSLYSAQPEEQIATKVSEIIQATGNARANEVWPGFNIATAPTVVSFSQKGLYLFDSNSGNTRWEKTTLAGKKAFYTAQDAWNVASIPFLANFDLEGESAYVFNMDPVLNTGDPLSYHIFVHERFHRYQFEHFKQKKDFGSYRDQMNIENLTFIQLEEKALFQFMQTDGNSKKEALLDFVALNTVRRLLIAPSSILWEDHQQKMEGLAEYVSFKLFDTFPELQVEKGSEKLAQLLLQYSKNPEIMERTMKWRHYGVGAAVGYALDSLHVKNWKERVENEDVSLVEMLTEAQPLSAQELLERLNIALISYQVGETHATAKANVESYQARTQKVMQTYKQIDGIEISITSPSTVAISGKGTTDKNLSLPNGANVSINDNSIFSSSDQKWRLELSDQPYVFQAGPAREFKCEKEAVVEIDGEKVTIQDALKRDTRRTFSSIRIEGKGTHFSSVGASGRIWVDQGGRLLIRFL